MSLSRNGWTPEICKLIIRYRYENRYERDRARVIRDEFKASKYGFCKKKRKENHRFSGVKGKKRVGIFSTHPLCGSKHSISIGAIFFLSFFLPPPPSLLPFFFYSFDSKRKQGTFLGRVIRFFENKIRVDTCEFIDRMQQFV